MRVCCPPCRRREDAVQKLINQQKNGGSKITFLFWDGMFSVAKCKCLIF